MSVTPVEILIMNGDSNLLGELESEKLKHNTFCETKGAEIYWSSPEFWVLCPNCNHQLIHLVEITDVEFRLLFNSNLNFCKDKTIKRIRRPWN